MTIIQKLPKGLQVSFISIFCFLLFVFCFLLLFHLLFWHKIYPGVEVAHINLGGKTQVQAAQILNQALSKQNNTLKLIYQNQTWEINLPNLGFAYFPLSASRKAYLVGRSGDLKKDFKQKLRGLKKEINLNFDYQISQS